MNKHVAPDNSITIPKSYKLLLLLFAVVIAASCNQNKENDSVKLDEPLKDALPKITLIVPEEQDKDGKPLEIMVGNTHSGKSEYSIGDGETRELEYTLLNQHAVEGKKFIYTVVSYNKGGSGSFYYLTAIDKSTLKSVNEVLLGDRVKINSLALSLPKTDSVTINYMNRESGTAMTEDPDNDVTKHYSMELSKLSEVWIEKF